MKTSLSSFQILTFDCYGTLIDWETGIWDALQPLLARDPNTQVTRATALSTFAELESDQESKTPSVVYEEILTRVHQRLAVALGLDSTAEEDHAFGASVPIWPAFPDTAEALRSLAHRYKLVILSNISNRAIAASNKKLGVTFDAIHTAEEIGSYKPSPENFRYLLNRLDTDFNARPSDVLHVAQSLFHDHVPAIAAGLSTAWIDRQGLSKGGSWGATAVVENPPKTDFIFDSMAALADAARG